MATPFSPPPLLPRMRQGLRDLAARLLEAARLLPELFRKPAVLLRWLLGARAAQISLAVALILAPKLLPSALDALLEAIFPPVKQDRLFGLVRTTSTHPAVEKGGYFGRMVIWTGSGGAVLVLLLLQVPAALRRTEEEAARIEAEGDSLAGSEPSRSLLLYRSALRLSTDPVREESLALKLAGLDGRSAGASVAGPSPAFGRSDATLCAPSGASLGIGPGGRYRIEGELGRGAMGIVYRARDAVLERSVALKELPVYLAQDAERVSRFRQEARVLARLSHPNIVHLYDLIEEEGRILLAMELVEGGDLETLLEERGALPVPLAARLGVQIAEALAYTHERGIVHRDLKSANVLLTAQGVPKITDFGLAKLAQSSQATQEGAILGSPLYMSPEQAAGRPADHRSDLYSLGILLYRMVTGNPPFRGETASVLAQHLTQPPEAPRAAVPGLPEELERLILSLLEKDPERREQDPAAISSTLHRLAQA